AVRRFEIDEDGPAPPGQWVVRLGTALVRAVDAEYLRAEVGEHHAGERPGSRTGDLHDPHAVQRAGHSRHPRPGLEDVHRACRREPDDVGEADPGAFDLPVARLAAQVRGDFVQVGDAGRADRVALGQQASGDVDRDLALAPRGSGVDEVTGPARLAQPQVVVVDQ